MKEFNLEEAKAGKLVCTRDGHEVRILYYDAKGGDDTRIVALIDVNGVETPMSYYKDGKVLKDAESVADLMMAGEKRRGWLGLYNDPCGDRMARTTNVYKKKEEVEEILNDYEVNRIVAIIQIEWDD